jgi:hypothetical protein
MASIVLPPPPTPAPPPTPPIVKLPLVLPVGTVGIETDVATLVTSPVPINTDSTITLSGTLTATMLPKSSTSPALLTIAPPLSKLTLEQGTSIVLTMSALAPWRHPLLMPSHERTSIVVNVTVYGGLVLNTTTVVLLQEGGVVKVSAGADLLPGPYLLRVAPIVPGTILPARRWIYVSLKPKRKKLLE